MKAREVSRRRFLQGLGFGAGASILMPISDRLLCRAVAETSVPKKRLIVMSVYTLEPVNYRPAAVGGDNPGVQSTIPEPWPEMFAPLGDYLSQAVFVDGLRNFLNAATQHRSGTSALSCLVPTNGNPESMGPAGGITIDQLIANVLSAGAPHGSILWGLTGGQVEAGTKQGSGIFATGPEQNISHFTNPRELMDRLFPDSEAIATPGARRPVSFRPLRDRLLSDLQRLNRRLAPEERRGLESYEKAIIDFDAKQEALLKINCETPPDAPKNKEPQDHLASMMAQSTLALECGLSQVVGITIGTANDHNKHIPGYRDMAANSSDPEVQASGIAKAYGHAFSTPQDTFYYVEAARNLHRVHFRELSGVMDRLSNIFEDDGSSLMDHTAILYVASNGISDSGHHVGKNSVLPGLLIAGKATGFRTEGRFLSFPSNINRGETIRNVADLYRTVAIGLGVNPAGFAEGAQHTKGPIYEILS
jgi:hypothetical protein